MFAGSCFPSFEHWMKDLSSLDLNIWFYTVVLPRGQLLSSRIPHSGKTVRKCIFQAVGTIWLCRLYTASGKFSHAFLMGSCKNEPMNVPFNLKQKALIGARS